MTTSTSTPLMRLTGVRREYPSGDGTFVALRDVDLAIEAGEMVAIVGASGSGKSTLMNILGCLDRASAGSYAVDGQETRELGPDELATLRREHFGFIFQRYQLLGDVSAMANVAMPALYAGVPRQARDARAGELLARLGLGTRTSHRPGQLSGGQQQRVSIARALMNGGRVILADEPTGALDRASGVEVMRILGELHAEGHTIILVTHDMAVAEHASRIIEISDGAIIADRRKVEVADDRAITDTADTAQRGGRLPDRLAEAFRMAVAAMNAHRLRTALTMLGIVIGIASVVSVVTLGNGAQAKILSDISSLGTSTLDIYPGTGPGDTRAGQIETLVTADADALAAQPYVDSVSPGSSVSVKARYGNVVANAQVNGVGTDYFRVRGLAIGDGRSFDAAAVLASAQEIVIDARGRDVLFPAGVDPLGAVVMLGNVPVRVVGVLRPSSSPYAAVGDLNVYAPTSTVMNRLLGRSSLKSITVRIADGVSTDAAEAAVTRLLTTRHGTTDIFVSNSDEVRRTIAGTTGTMKLLVGAIAVISLIVGGIGVMNIMLVSVTERTGEIGVRMAIGARRSDILQQFLIEAVLVCLIGGMLGVALALAISTVFSLLVPSFPMALSATSIIAAFACSTAIGVVFGFVPARNAAKLDPVEALARA